MKPSMEVEAYAEKSSCSNKGVPTGSVSHLTSPYIGLLARNNLGVPVIRPEPVPTTAPNRRANRRKLPSQNCLDNGHGLIRNGGGDADPRGRCLPPGFEDHQRCSDRL